MLASTSGRLSDNLLRGIQTASPLHRPDLELEQLELPLCSKGRDPRTGIYRRPVRRMLGGGREAADCPQKVPCRAERRPSELLSAAIAALPFHGDPRKPVPEAPGRRACGAASG